MAPEQMDANDVILECDPGTNASDIMTELDAFPPAGFTFVEDCAALGDLTITHDWDGTVPMCDGGGNSGMLTVEFTVEDLCGNAGTFEVDVIIEDTQAPIISGIQDPINATPIECDGNVEASATTALTNAIAAATFMDPNDCTDPSVLIANAVFAPDPLGDPVQITNCTYEYIVDIFTEDECLNLSNTVTTSIFIEDTTGPELQDPCPVDITVDCGSDIPAGQLFSVNDACEGFIDLPPTDDESGLFCPDDGVVIRTWDIVDNCGNVNATTPQCIQNITVGPAGTLQWIDEDANLPDDISFVLGAAECEAGDYNFPMCVWADDPSNPTMTWPNPADFMEGVQFTTDKNCGNLDFTYSLGPCPFEPGGSILITYEVSDECGNTLSHQFEVEIICANCSDGTGTYCAECEESALPENEGVCNTCNVAALLSGFSSCNPIYEGMIQGAPQPNPLCNGGGVPNNMSWFSFVAGGPDIDVSVNVEAGSCIPGEGGLLGVQGGIYDFCDGECITGVAACSAGEDPIDFNTSDLIVGMTYYLFVDGCAGSECQYDIVISGQDAFVLDDMEETIVQVDCESPFSEPNTFCPGMVVKFNTLHDGSSVTDWGEYDPPGSTYSPDAELEFTYSFTPPLDGYSFETWDQIELGGECTTPDITLPDVTVPTNFIICIEDVVHDCDDADCVGDDNCCLTITVQPLPTERFVFDVCIEDLQEATGWDPSAAVSAAGSAQFGWLGPNNITIADVNSMDTLTYMVEDPSCGCAYEQKLKINIIGNEIKTPKLLYMYECQFFEDLELEHDYEEYVWEFPDQEVDIPINAEELCVRIFEYSLELDWDTERCDSILLVTVDTLELFADIQSGPCTPSGTEYTWQLLLDDTPPEYPEIDANYLVEWVDCDNPNDTEFTGASFPVNTSNEGEYCVKVTYTFLDNVYDPVPVQATCEELFGPYDLETGIPLPPSILGETTFCENDLQSQTLTVDVPMGTTETYEWDTNGSGAVLTSQLPDGSSATFDLTGHDFGVCLIVTANTACGPASTDVCLSTIALPTPQFDLTSQICLGESAQAIETVYGNGNAQITDWEWTPTAANSAGPVTFTQGAAGVYDVELVVIDSAGCASNPITMQYEIFEPLEKPVVSCLGVTDSSVEFGWNAVPNAVDYIITEVVAGGAAVTTTVPATQLNIEYTGLGISETVSITVIAVGMAPCGDSEATTVDCTTDDCSDPDYVFDPAAIEFCVESPIAGIDFNNEIEIKDGGSFAFTGDPAGAYITAGGVFDPVNLTPGNYTITTIYSYNNGDCNRPGPTIPVIVYDTPSADFTVSVSEICLGEGVIIDDTNVDIVPSWDYDGGQLGAGNEVTWDIPGMKTITVDVLTPDGCVNSTTQMVNVLDTLILDQLDCINSSLDFVHFDWNDVIGATDYTVTYTVNGGAATMETLTDSEIIIDGLDPNDIVEIIVDANAGPGYCGTFALSEQCEAIPCVPLVFNSLSCTETDLDFVRFEWLAVDGATTFEVFIDGVSQGIQTDLFFVNDGMSPGESVDIRVVAINDIAACDDVFDVDDCTAGNCPDVVFSNNITGPYCWKEGDPGIPLSIFTEDVDGNSLPGTITWDTQMVDADGNFTPINTEDNTVYTLNFDFEDVDGCPTPGAVDVEIIITPDPNIANISNICITDLAQVVETNEYVNGEILLWEWDGGSTTGEGPHDIGFANQGEFTVTLTVSNGPDCVGTATATLEVSEALISPTLDCNSNNSSIEFFWTSVNNVTAYDITINGVPQGIQDTTGFTVTEDPMDGSPIGPGDEATIVISFLSMNDCDLDPIMLTCQATNCAPGVFVQDAYTEELCLDGTESSQQLSATLNNGPTEPLVDESWSGMGPNGIVLTDSNISQNGLFNPAGLDAGTYEITYRLEYPELCIYRTLFTIVLHSAPVPTIDAVNPDCFMDNLGSVTAGAQGGTPPYTYQLGTLDSQMSPEFDIVAPGTYDLVVTDNNGCTGVTPVTIIPAPEPIPGISGPFNLSETETGSYVLTGIESLDVGNIIWSIDGVAVCEGLDCEPLDISAGDYPEGFTLMATVVFNDDCFVETMIRVEVFDIQKWYIPNVISRTGSEENQNWAMFYKGRDIIVNSVRIFDRWGELVHVNESLVPEVSPNGFTKIDFDWQGQFGDSGNVEQGVYVYVVDMLVSGRPVVESDDITVLR